MSFTILNEADVFNGNQAEIDKVDLDILAAAHAGSGVLSGCEVTAQGVPDNTVAIAAGTVVVAGTQTTVGGGALVCTPDATNPRFYLIVSNNVGSISSVAGTPAAEPVFPAIPANSVVLAAVYVPANDNTIESDHITDKRMMLRQVAHSELTGVTANQHHAQAHAIGGADHTGQLGHGALSGLANDDHTQYLKEKLSGGSASEIPGHSHTGASEAGTVSHLDLTNWDANTHHAADRIQDDDNDTFDDVEVGTDPDFATHGRAATAAVFDKWLKGAELSPRIQLQDDGLALGDGSVVDLFLRRIADKVFGLYQTAADGNALEITGMTAPGAAAGNSLRLYARTFGTGVGAFLKDQNGTELGPIGMKEQATIQGRGPSGGLEAPRTTNWYDGAWGTLGPPAAAGLWTPTGTPSVANDTGARRGRHIAFLSGAVAGNDAGIETPAVFFANENDSYLIRFFLPDITNIRFFAGVAAQTLTTMVGADNPGTNHLGIQFSTPRADANWQFTERGTGAQVLTNSGVAALATEPFYIQIITGTVTQMTLLDSIFRPVATRLVGVLSKPGGTVAVAIIAGIETQTAAGRTLQLYHINHHARSS